MTDDEKRRNVELAYLALTLSGKPINDLNLTAETLRVSRALGDNSLAMIVQNSVRIVAKVLSQEFEESSQRYLITFRAFDSEKDEHIRSERADGSHGERVHQLWNRNLVGHACIIYKFNEKPKGDKASGKNASGYRVAPYIYDLGIGR